MRTLTPSEYSAIRRQLNFTINHSITVVMAAADIGIVAISLFLLFHSGTVGYLLSQLLLSIVFFRAFCLLHECGHESATRFRWLNTLLGHCVSILCFLPYYSWKHSHNQHHAWSGNLKHDPSLGLLRHELYANSTTLFCKIRRGIVMLAWISWLPLLGISQTLLFWFYPFTLIANFRKNKKKIVQSLLSTLFLVGFYIGLVSVSPENFTLKNFAIAILLFFAWVELINFPHHMNMEVIDENSPSDKFTVREQSRSTRSCYYPKFISEFLLCNFNFHIEHHLFPKLPWHQLRHARSLVKGRLEDSYNEEIGLAWNIKHRKNTDLEKCFLDHTPVRSTKN